MVEIDSQVVLVTQYVETLNHIMKKLQKRQRYPHV